jgi:hypothetical protein
MVVGPDLLGLHGARRGASPYSGQNDDRAFSSWDVPAAPGG